MGGLFCVSPRLPSLGVGPQLGLVSETCLPVPHEELEVVRFEGEGKTLSRLLWGQGRNCRLHFSHSSREGGAEWSLEPGLWVPVPCLNTRVPGGLTSGFYISLGVRG